MCGITKPSGQCTVIARCSARVSGRPCAPFRAQWFPQHMIWINWNNKCRHVSYSAARVHVVRGQWFLWVAGKSISPQINRGSAIPAYDQCTASKQIELPFGSTGSDQNWNQHNMFPSVAENQYHIVFHSTSLIPTLLHGMQENQFDPMPSDSD